jgi:hypothetical protein
LDVKDNVIETTKPIKKDFEQMGLPAYSLALPSGFLLMTSLQFSLLYACAM